MQPSATDDRRAAMLALAEAVRALNDAFCMNALDAHELDQLQKEVEALTSRLAARTHPGPYSGLLKGRVDIADPGTYLPFAPMAGPFNPIAPPLRLAIGDGRVHGTVTLGRQHGGPPRVAHGGTLASLCDQMVAVAAWTAGVGGITRSLTVRYLKPTPLHCALDLVAWSEPIDERRANSVVEIRSGDELTVRATAETVVAKHVTDPA